MRPLIYLILLAGCPLATTAQCLTDFSKLVPETSLDVTQQYGRISMYDNYMAIGLPENDSLGRIVGIVRIFEKTTDGWKIIATVAPSNPRDAMQFGSAVKLSSNYLLVAGGSYAKEVYLFKKSAGGWQSQTELTSFFMSDGQLFGTPYQNQSTIDISSDEQTIAITDSFYRKAGENWSGAVFVYHKPVASEWSGSITPVVIKAPEDDAADFGRAGVAIHGDRIITGTPFAPTANGRLYVFRDPTGEFLDLELEAKLSAYESDKTAWLGYTNFAVTNEGIFTTITVDFNTPEAQNVIAFYEIPATGAWHDTDYTCVFPYHAEPISTNSFPIVASNGTDIIVSSRQNAGAKTGYTTLLKKGTSGWCDPVRELADSTELVPGQFESVYGAIAAINQLGDIAVGMVPHPNLSGSNVSLKMISKNVSGEWEGSVLSGNGRSTAGHRYGTAILGFEDYLFVGASGDGTIKPNAGAVYVYKKTAGTWSQTGKIIAPVKGRYDDVFGSALATNGTQLAVGAAGFEDHGRIFIYNKNDADWSAPELAQEIELPTGILTVYAYGDNVAMNDEWLLIPYVQNSPARIMLACYKYNGTEWVYNQVVEMGLGNFFARSTTLAIAIHGSTIVAGSSILELSPGGIWQRKYVLSPSDPEPQQIAPDFSHWITNGASFGQAVAITDNTIFIAAPTKDFGTTWDVGAIYVYTKKPWESWSNRTESAKILPRIKSERELFGYSLKALGNTLIVGAPGSDQNKDGTARNKPGRVYIFQSEDYFWQHVTPLIDMTGDSFVKDYFGLTVNLDETDFFIGAPIEDLETGKLSGSVYITPTPPIVKLVPPVCSSYETIQLFGYPFGGVWAGPGLIDAAEGIFDPKVAGIGEHEFTYTTPSCAYQGRLRIRVEEPITPVLLVNEEHFVCQYTSVQIPLAVEAQSGYQYQWHYRATDRELFQPLSQRQEPTLTATLRGEYKVELFNTVCASFSPVIVIKNDSADLELTPVERICADAGAGITLTATPPGGEWTGSGVNAGKLFSTSLSNGWHTLTYSYQSPRQCIYQKSMQVQVDRLAFPVIQRTGDLCVDGVVSLGMTSPLDTDVTYSWMRTTSTENPFTSTSYHGPNVLVNERGIYQLEAYDGKCRTVSNAITVQENTFPLEMEPAEASFVVCDQGVVELEIDHRTQNEYTWYVAETADDPGVVVTGASTNSLAITESGFYYALVTSGMCVMESPRKQVTIKPVDEINVPNVFTANGDEYNTIFSVQSNVDILGLRISNRYGTTIYTAGANTGWDGEDSPAGVYYWFVTYRTCIGEVKTLKGFVHLIK